MILKQHLAFTTQAGTFNDRFVLRFTQKTLGIDDVSPENYYYIKI
jgi:hypothetical protein